MLSILTQNKDTIYYNPNVKKLYIVDKRIDNKLQYEVRATIDNDDRLLGRYSNKAVAQEVMNDLISESYWNDTGVFCMPEDESICQ